MLTVPGFVGTVKVGVNVYVGVTIDFLLESALVEVGNGVGEGRLERTIIPPSRTAALKPISRRIPPTLDSKFMKLCVCKG